MKQPVHRRFRRDVDAFVCELRHDLARRFAPESLARQNVEHRLTLVGAEGIVRLRLRPASPVFLATAPALQRSSVDAELLARDALARACSNRLFDQLEDSSSFFDSVEASSSPHRAFAFFRSTSSAAASASAFSLRLSSRSSSLTRFASADLPVAFRPRNEVDGCRFVSGAPTPFLKRAA